MEADAALANAAASAVASLAVVVRVTAMRPLDSQSLFEGACEQHGAWQTATRLFLFLGQAVDTLTIGASALLAG